MIELKSLSEKALNRVNEERDKLTAQVDDLNMKLLEAKQETALVKETTNAKDINADIFNRVMAATEANAQHYQSQIRELRKLIEENSKNCEMCCE